MLSLFIVLLVLPFVLAFILTSLLSFSCLLVFSFVPSSFIIVFAPTCFCSFPFNSCFVLVCLLLFVCLLTYLLAWSFFTLLVRSFFLSFFLSFFFFLFSVLSVTLQYQEHSSVSDVISCCNSVVDKVFGPVRVVLLLS